MRGGRRFAFPPACCSERSVLCTQASRAAPPPLQERTAGQTRARCRRRRPSQKWRRRPRQYRTPPDHELSAACPRRRAAWAFVCVECCRGGRKSAWAVSRVPFKAHVAAPHPTPPSTDPAHLDVPDGASCVDAAGAQAFRVVVVPIKGGQGGAELGGLVLRRKGCVCVCGLRGASETALWAQEAGRPRAPAASAPRNAANRGARC